MGSRKLSDILALQALQAAYCETVDECATDPAGATARFNEILSADVRADYGMSLLTGRVAVIAFLVGTGRRKQRISVALDSYSAHRCNRR